MAPRAVQHARTKRMGRSTSLCAAAELWLPIVALAMMSVACGTGYPIGAENAKPLVLNDAESDLNCPAADIRVTEGWGGSFEAVGCGEVRRYKANCDGTRCIVHKDDEPPVPFKDRPAPEDVPR
jgi:hypothetical protein